MSLNTITLGNPPVNEWFDFVNRQGDQAIVDMNIFNRGVEGSQVALAISEENRNMLNTPTNLTVTKEGIHEGSTTYSYRVSAIDNNGETLASANVLVEGAENELNDDHYISLSWDAVTGAEGYRIYGRLEGAEQLLTQVTTTTYDDKELDVKGDPVPYFNTTGIEAILWEGEIDVDTLLEVTNRKIFISSDLKLIAYTTAPYLDFIAFSADA